MTPVRFGDLVDAATRHLDEADRALTDDVSSQEAARLLSIIRALGTYLDDLVLAPTVADVPAARADPWEHAAFDLRDSLRLAMSSLMRRPTSDPDQPEEADESSAARHLQHAATALAAGHDLLRTHIAADPYSPAYRSPWAPVITSPTVRRVLTEEVARHAVRLLPLAKHLDQQAPASASGPDNRAFRYLWLAADAGGHAQDVHPVTDDDRMLLRGIPAAVLPDHIPPTAGESVPDLCTGIAATAERLRLATFSAVQHATWSPIITARSWQEAAMAAAITVDTAARALRILAEAEANPGPLHSTTDLLGNTRDHWLQCRHALADIATETSFVASPANSETTDLVLRMGRLAFDNPRWTPSREHRSSPPRGQVDPAIAVQVLSAIHDAIDALAIMAACDTAAIRAAGQAQRLYRPTRLLPETEDIPRPYAIAPTRAVSDLIAQYARTTTATEDAASALGAIAQALDAPSRILALAREATQLHPRASVTSVGRQPSSRTRPTVEQQLRELGVTDPGFHLRAAAIDRAAADLIDQARSAARLAAMDTPGPDMTDNRDQTSQTSRRSPRHQDARTRRRT